MSGNASDTPPAAIEAAVIGDRQLPKGAASGISQLYPNRRSSSPATVLSMAHDGAVLALDVGTSSCRASLYDLRGRPIKDRFAHIAYAPTVTPDGGAELDPNLLFEQLCSAIDQVLHNDPPKIRAVATDTFWHSLLGVDADGQPLTPLY